MVAETLHGRESATQCSLDCQMLPALKAPLFLPCEYDCPSLIQQTKSFCVGSYLYRSDLAEIGTGGAPWLNRVLALQARRGCT